MTAPQWDQEPREAHKIDGRHAMYAGWIAGIAIRNGVQVDPVLIDDQVTDQFDVIIPRPGHRIEVRVIVVVPPPPDDWSLDG
jgi:hypothetical protein